MGLDQDLYLISMAARMLGMHPQTLRKYERLGLVQPSRTIGSMRLYSRDELERLKVIKRLVDDGGINLAGVQRLLSIAEVVQRIRPLVMVSREDTLSARDARRRLGQELDELLRMLGID
jgi:MerR family transcriptional regulator/heat shock protein HspR